MPDVLSVKDSDFTIIATAELYGEIDDVQKFGYDPKGEIKEYPGGLGYEGTKYVAAIYKNCEGSFSVQNTAAQKKILALLQHVALNNYVGFHLKNARTCYIVAHARDDIGQLITSSFIEAFRISQKPTDYGDGEQQINFTAPSGMDLAKEIAIETFNGAATPVTALTLGETAVADPLGRTVMLVLKDTATVKGAKLELTTDYTATTSAVTLVQGLAEGEKALVVYLKAGA
jgi:hypothetical protein